MTVPCFLDQPGCPPGSRFQLGPDGLPQRIPGNTYEAAFICNIPRSATPAHPARPSLYGHGLFGDAGEVGRRQRRAARQREQRDRVRRRLDRDGGGGRRPTRSRRCCDLSRLPAAWRTASSRASSTSCSSGGADPPDGFAADPAFQDDGRPLIDTRRLFYYGNSQGGIAGGALTARGAGLQPLRALRGRDELQPAAHPQRRLRRLRARCSTRPTPTSCERPLLLSLIQIALGPRRAERLRLAHDGRSAAEHAHATRCSAALVRRPPGGQRRHRGGGPHDRVAHAPARPSIRAGTPTRRPTTASRRSTTSRTGVTRRW